MSVWGDISSGRIGVPSVIVCPRCEGQLYDRGSCSICENSGYLCETTERLSFPQRVQMLAVLAMSLGWDVTLPEGESQETLAAKLRESMEARS